MIKFIKANKKNSLYLMSAGISLLAVKIYLFTLPWFLLEKTQSATIMGITFLFQFLPSLIVSPIVGLIIDRTNKKKLIILSNALQCIIILIVGYIIPDINKDNLSIIFIACAILSMLNSFSFVSEETILPQLFKKEDLIKANSIYELNETLITLIAPLISGAIIAKFGVNSTMFFSGLCFIPILIIAPLIKTEYYNSSRMAGKFSEQVKLSITFLKKEKVIIYIMLLALIANISHGIIDSMFLYFTKEFLGFSPLTVGLIMTISGTLQMSTIFIIRFIENNFSHIKMLSFTNIISGIGMLTLSLSNNLFLVTLGRSVQEVPIIIANILNKTIRQKLVPIEMLGSINSLNNSISMVTYPMAGFFAGILSDIYGINIIYLIAGILIIFTTIMLHIISENKILRKEDVNESK